MQNFFGHEYDPFLGKDFTIAYNIGGNVPGTAVVRIHTQEEFVVAADGLRRNLAGLEVTDKQQKIFSIKQRGGLIVYALSGITYIQDGPIIFSVSDVVGKIAKELLMEHFTSADRYVTRFGKLANDALRKGQKDGIIKDFQNIGKQGQIVKILLAGYFKTKPFMADITLSHERQKLQTPQLEFKGYMPDDTEIKVAGSEVVLNEILRTDNPNFARFRSMAFMKVRNRQALSKLDAVELARNYIAACADPKGRELDPECVGIGGHVHIATITLGEGFQWIDPPASL